MKELSYLGKTIQVIIDRPLGTKHPRNDMIYQLNYGYIPDTVGGDGDPIDVYILDVNEPIEATKAKVIGVIVRNDDVENKLVAVVSEKNFSEEEIRRLTYFQEQYFDIKIIT